MNTGHGPEDNNTGNFGEDFDEGFGTAGTPGAIVGTEWTGGDIWLRREFELENALDVPLKNVTMKCFLQRTTTRQWKSSSSNHRNWQWRQQCRSQYA